MNHYVRITRTPYEEPFHLELLLEVSKGRQTAALQIYINAVDLIGMAKALEDVPRHATDVYVYELGSERVEDRFGYYLRFRAFVTDGGGHCALQFRMNNNEDLPGREVAEFCIETEAASVNRLGKLLRTFARLEHTSLFWSSDEATLE
jgi:hypothetical protein